MYIVCSLSNEYDPFISFYLVPSAACLQNLWRLIIGTLLFFVLIFLGEEWDSRKARHETTFS